MNIETKPGVIKGVLQAIKNLGNSDTIDYSNEEIIMVHPALVETLNKIANGKLIKDAETAVNVSGGSKKGVLKQYKAPSISVAEMTPEKLEEMKKILETNNEEKDISK